MPTKTSSSVIESGGNGTVTLNVWNFPVISVDYDPPGEVELATADTTAGTLLDIESTGDTGDITITIPAASVQAGVYDFGFRFRMPPGGIQPFPSQPAQATVVTISQGSVLKTITIPGDGTPVISGDVFWVYCDPVTFADGTDVTIEIAGPIRLLQEVA